MYSLPVLYIERRKHTATIFRSCMSVTCPPAHAVTACRRSHAYITQCRDADESPRQFRVIVVSSTCWEIAEIWAMCSPILTVSLSFFGARCVKKKGMIGRWAKYLGQIIVPVFSGLLTQFSEMVCGLSSDIDCKFFDQVCGWAINNTSTSVLWILYGELNCNDLAGSQTFNKRARFVHCQSLVWTKGKKTMKKTTC